LGGLAVTILARPCEIEVEGLVNFFTRSELL
jgi:hypothetical protein